MLSLTVLVCVWGGPSLPLPASSGCPQPLASHQLDGRLLAMCPHIISSLCMSVCVQTPPFYKDTIRFGLGATLVTSLSLGYLCKDPISKEGHSLRYWALGFPRIFLGDTLQPTFTGNLYSCAFVPHRASVLAAEACGVTCCRLGVRPSSVLGNKNTCGEPSSEFQRASGPSRATAWRKQGVNSNS